MRAKTHTMRKIPVHHDCCLRKLPVHHDCCLGEKSLFMAFVPGVTCRPSGTAWFGNNSWHRKKACPESWSVDDWSRLRMRRWDSRSGKRGQYAALVSQQKEVSTLTLVSQQKEVSTLTLVSQQKEVSMQRLYHSKKRSVCSTCVTAKRGQYAALVSQQKEVSMQRLCHSKKRSVCSAYVTAKRGQYAALVLQQKEVSTLTLGSQQKEVSMQRLCQNIEISMQC